MTRGNEEGSEEDVRRRRGRRSEMKRWWPRHYAIGQNQSLGSYGQTYVCPKLECVSLACMQALWTANRMSF